LLSGERKINLTIEDPLIEINEDLSLLSDSGVSTNTKFTINKVNLRNGELHYVSEKLSVTLLDFDVFSYSKGENISFRIISPHMKIIFPLNKKEVKLEGDLESEFINKKKVFKISKFRWGTKDLIITGNGNIYKGGNLALHIFTDGSYENVLYPILKGLTAKGDVKGKTTIVKDTAGRVLINGNFSAPEISVNDEKFYQFRGNVKWNNRAKKIKLRSTTFADGLLTALNVDTKKFQTKIEISNVSASKLGKMIDIYENVPMGGIIKKCDLDITSGHMKGSFSIEKEVAHEDEFNVDGNFDIEYHLKEKWIKFKSTDTISEFGIVNYLNGFVDTRRKIMKIDLNSTISELSGADKYLKTYVDMDLAQWGLKKGSGNLSMNFSKNGKRTEIKSRLSVKDLISNDAPLDSISAEVRTLNNRTDIDLLIKDKDLNGKAFITYESGTMDIDFKDIVGESSKIFKILEKDLNLKGILRGNFKYHSEKGMKDPLITGNYLAHSLNFYDFIFKDVIGELEVLDHILLRNLKFNYHNGEGQADILVNYETDYFKIDGKISSIDINEINKGFEGKGNLQFSGEGEFNKDPLNIKYDSPAIKFYADRPFSVMGEGEVMTDFSEFVISAPGILRNNSIDSPFIFVFRLENDKYLGSFDIDLKDINVVMPWENNKGTMNLSSEIISDENDNIHFRGVADLGGEYISFPGFPHTLDNFKGSLFFRDLDFIMRSFSGKMGGGDVTGNGKLKVENNELQDLLVTFNGKNMFLFPMERANFRMNANLNIQKKKEKYVLGGAINFLSLLWEKEFDEDMSFYAGTGSKGTKQSSFLDNLEYDLTMRGKNDLNVSNSFLRGKGEVDLHLTGNIDFPILSGSISGREGAVLISGREFNLVKARLVFNNKVRINPLIRIEAETFIKSYRIKFLISGLSSGMRPEFISSPPLPQQDIIALISLGELFRRSSSTNISSEVGTTGLVTTALTDQIQRRVKKLFGIDMLKLDPDPTRSSLEGISRLTIGKSISKDFLIVYSTDISRATRDVYFFQYQITPTISLIGKRNEEGRLSMDIRFRKRY